MSDRLFTQRELETLVSALLSGATPAQVSGLAPETLESLYALAHGLYTSGNHKDAQTLFQALSLYNPNDSRFWLGLGGSRQALKDYRGAVDAYQMAGVASALKDPTPFYYAAKCLVELGERADAKAALEGALAFGKENPEFDDIRRRCAALLELLKED